MHLLSQIESPSRWNRVFMAAVLLFFTAAGAYLTSGDLTFDDALNNDDALPPPSIIDNINPTNRQLSIALPNGGCQVTYAHLTETPIPPTWQASFPGSGARMTWSLVEALTGIRTNDDYDSHSRGYEKVVAVKTHYPVKDAKRRFKGLDVLFNRSVVILRNPINAIPSYFNLQYEHMNHLPNHSTRGPNEDWIKYRDNPNYGVTVQVESYEKFVDYWMTKYPERNQILLLSYEDLTDNYVGPIAATRIANFLGESEGVNPIAAESIPCVWETIVNYKNLGAPPDNVQADGTVPQEQGQATGRKNQRKLKKQRGRTDNVDEQNIPVEENAGNVQVEEVKNGKRNKNRRLKNGTKQGRTSQSEVEGDDTNERKAMRRRLRNSLQKESKGEESNTPNPDLSWEELKKLGVKGGKTHADPSSLRTGPKVRPYTAQNLSDMVAMFERLMERYKYDEDFVRIMASYIETVSNTVPAE